MKPKQIRANMFFLSAQYKKNKQGRAIAGTEEVLDAGVESMLELEKKLTRMEEIIFNQRHYARQLHAEYKWCRDMLIKNGLFNRTAVKAFIKKELGIEEDKDAEQV